MAVLEICKVGAGLTSAVTRVVIPMGAAMAAISRATVRRCVLALSAIALLLASSLAAVALSMPARTGWVTDAANILDANTMSSLSTRLENLQSETGDEVVVVTLPDLQGATIEDWGDTLGNSWKIGKTNGRNDGVLLVVAPNERRVRIAVGYGLANRIPDSIAASIISDHIIPYFRNGDMLGGIRAGIDSIALQLSGGAAANGVEQAAYSTPQPSFWWWLGHRLTPNGQTLIIIFWVVIGIFIFVFMVRNAGNVGSSNGPRNLRDEYDNAYDLDTNGSDGRWGRSSGSSSGGGSFGGGASGSW